jgi:hypothetical protein
MGPSNFVLANLHSFRTHIDMSLRDYPEFLNEDIVNTFLLNNVNKYLISFGIALQKNPKKITNKIIKRFDKCYYNKSINRKLLDGVELSIDSGGYQLQTGYLKKELISDYVDLYHDDLIPTHSDHTKYFFTIDIAPGGDSGSVIDSWKTMIELNNLSYKKTRELKKEYKDKMIYIHHFRTPKLFDMHNKFLFEDGLADGLLNFSTGGLASYLIKLSSPDYVMYTIPLVSILLYAKQKNIKKFRFHVLGASDWKDILYHRIFERHIKNVHDLDVEITFDSSTVGRTLGRARFFYLL